MEVPSDVEHNFTEFDGAYFQTFNLFKPRLKKREKENHGAGNCGDAERPAKKGTKHKKQHPGTQGDIGVEYSKRKNPKEYHEAQDDENVSETEISGKKKKGQKKDYTGIPVLGEQDASVEHRKEATDKFKSSEGNIHTPVLEHEACQAEHSKPHKRKKHDVNSVNEPSVCERGVSAPCSQDDIAFLFSREGTQHSESLLMPKHRKRKKHCHSGKGDVQQIPLFALGDEVSETKIGNDTCVPESTLGFSVPNILDDVDVSSSHECSATGLRNEPLQINFESMPTPSPVQEGASTSESTLYHRSSEKLESILGDRSMSQLHSSCSHASGSEKSDASVIHGTKHKRKRRGRGETFDGGSADLEDVLSFRGCTYDAEQNDSSISVSGNNAVYGSSQGFIVSSGGFDVDVSPFKHPDDPKPGEVILRTHNKLQHLDLSCKEVSVGTFSSEHSSPSSGWSRHVGGKTCARRDNSLSLDLSEKFDVTSKQSSVAAYPRESSGAAERVGEQQREEKEPGKVPLGYRSPSIQGTRSGESEDVDLFADILSPPILSPRKPKKKKYRVCDGVGPAVELNPHGDGLAGKQCSYAEDNEGDLDAEKRDGNWPTTESSLRKDSLTHHHPKKKSKKHKKRLSLDKECPILQEDKGERCLYAEDNDGGLEAEKCDGNWPTIEFSLQKDPLTRQCPKKKSKKHKKRSSSNEECPILQEDKGEQCLYAEHNEGGLEAEKCDGNWPTAEFSLQKDSLTSQRPKKKTKKHKKQSSLNEECPILQEDKGKQCSYSEDNKGGLETEKCDGDWPTIEFSSQKHSLTHQRPKKKSKKHKKKSSFNEECPVLQEDKEKQCSYAEVNERGRDAEKCDGNLPTTEFSLQKDSLAHQHPKKKSKKHKKRSSMNKERSILQEDKGKQCSYAEQNKGGLDTEKHYGNSPTVEFILQKDSLTPQHFKKKSKKHKKRSTMNKEHSILQEEKGKQCSYAGDNEGGLDAEKCDGNQPTIEFSLLKDSSIHQHPKKKSKKHKKQSSFTEGSPIVQEDKQEHCSYAEENEGGLDAEAHSGIPEDSVQDPELVMQVLSQYFGKNLDGSDVPNECPKEHKRKSQKKHRKDSAEKKTPTLQPSLQPQSQQRTIAKSDNGTVSSQRRKKSQEKPHGSHQKDDRGEKLSADHTAQNALCSELSTHDSSAPSPREAQSPKNSVEPRQTASRKTALPTERSAQAPEPLMNDSDAALFSEDDSSNEEVSWALLNSNKGSLKDSSSHDADLSHVHDERPGSPVDHSFMEYAVRGEFPDIHKSSVEPAPGTIEAYEEQTGMTLRKHHFSAEEDAILKRNFKNIAKFFNLQHPHLILGHKGTQSSTEVQNAKKFAQQQKVLQLLGKDLPRRSLRMIYRRARALFHPLRMDTRITFNKEESDQVMALYARLGPKWHEIEKVMEKPADSIRVHFLQLEEKKYDVEKGRWEIEEEIRLQKAMRKFGHTEHNGRLPSGVTWEKIAKEVGTRGPIQCYKRWVYAFRRTERTKGHIKLWNIYDTMHLINEMYHIENMPCNDYDWKLINRRFPAAKKATTLCDRWKRLISTKVPNSKEMSMKEGAAYLYRYYLPALLSRRNISIERAVELSMCPRLKG